MYCRNCGNELIGMELYCDACGTPVVEGARAGAAGTGAAEKGIGKTSVAKKDASSKGDGETASVATPSQAARAVGCGTVSNGGSGFAFTSGNGGQGAYLSYEYARTTVRDDLAQATVDCYESLGYELTGQRAAAPGGHQATLSFRRSRKVASKAQLAKIKRTMDDTLSVITGLESQKTKKATVQALVIGIASALILGVGMCCTMVWQSLMVPGIIVGVVGILGCAWAYLRYRAICSSETARLNPEIEAAYDRLATLCEEAQAVLRTA